LTDALIILGCKRRLADFINCNRDVFYFTVEEYNAFCKESVGEELCPEYGSSKGKSLRGYIKVKPLNDVCKLLGDFIEFYETEILNTYKDLDCWHDGYDEAKRDLATLNGLARLVPAPLKVVFAESHVSAFAGRAYEDIKNGDYDSAVTKSRTLLEEAFIKILELSNVEVGSKGDLKKLYGQVKSICNMSGRKEYATVLNELISGLEKIVSAIAEMRNIAGDAHGHGDRRFVIKEHHARLCLNAAITVADFALSVDQNRKASKRI